MKQAPAIGFACRMSPALLAATVAIALLAAVAMSISGAPSWLRWILLVAVATVAVAALDGMLRPRIRSLRWRTDGGLDIAFHRSLADGREEAQGSIRGSRVMGPLIVLAIGWPPRGRTTLWLLPDNLDADTRRRLRMRLGADAGLASGNADSG